MENVIFKDMFEVETYHWWFVARRKIIRKVIENVQLPYDVEILDAGCGNGDNLALLSEFGHVVAIEKDSDAILCARNRNIGDVYQGSLPDDLPEIKKKFDLIVLLDVLEHIEKDEESLVSIMNLLKDNGKIVITVPAYQWLWTKRDELHHHKRRYSARELRQLTEKNSLKINYISYFNTLLFPLAVIERIKQKLLPPSTDELLNMPKSRLNYLLEKVFSFETFFINKFSFPYGLSIIAVIEKDNSV